jgi:uncharacterized protein (DUF427 family)
MTQTQDNLTKTSRRHPVPDGEITFEPTCSWVRGTVGDVTVVDSRNPVLIWEPGRAVPRYAFPSGDVRTDLLEIRGNVTIEPDPALATLVKVLTAYETDLASFRGPLDGRTTVTLHPTHVVAHG